jgi:hypothetical protein
MARQTNIFKSLRKIMKKNLVVFLVGTLCCFGLMQITRGVEEGHPQLAEYATIRWGGRENTHVIRPSGHVEFVADQLTKLKKPERADDRSFYMNAVMNAMAKEGYEFAGMTSDEIVMKRAVAH